MAYVNSEHRKANFREWYAANKHKLPHGSGKHLAEHAKDIVKLYSVDNKSTGEIGQIYGVDKTLIRRILIKNNIKLRSSKQIRKNRQKETNHKWTGYQQITGTVWGRIRKCAKQRKIKFEITIEDAWNLWIKQDGICALSGEQLTFPSTVEEFLSGQFTASLDRINSSKGYIVGNIQWVHKVVNIMKWSLKEKDFFDWCLKILKHRRKI